MRLPKLRAISCSSYTSLMTEQDQGNICRKALQGKVSTFVPAVKSARGCQAARAFQLHAPDVRPEFKPFHVRDRFRDSSPEFCGLEPNTSEQQTKTSDGFTPIIRSSEELRKCETPRPTIWARNLHRPPRLLKPCQQVHDKTHCFAIGSWHD